MSTKKTGCSVYSVLFLETALVIACLFIFRRFLLRDDLLVYSGSGSDTREQYIMWYNSVVNHIRSGRFSLWDFTNGFGGSMFNYYLFQPALLVIYMFGVLLGPSAIPGMMVWLIIGEILLSGLFCYLMLSEWGFAEEAKVISSFLYGFNGFFVIWGQHYGLGFACLELPLLILVTERAIRSSRACFAVAVVCMLIIASGYYQGYMILLGAALYVTIRVLLAELSSWFSRVRTWLSIGLAMGFGVLMGSFNLLPSIGSLSVTSRLTWKGSFIDRLLSNLSLYSGSYYHTLLLRLLGNNLQGTGRYYIGDGNYYEGVTVCMGGLTIVLLLQFIPLFFSAKKKISQYIAAALGILICVFMVTVKAGSWVFNGFQYAFARHTFLLFPIMALMACYTLDRILSERRICLPSLVLSELLCVFVCLKAWKEYPLLLYRRNMLILLAAVLVQGGILAVYAAGKIRRTAVSAVLGFMVFIATLSDVFLCYNNRETVSKSDEVYFGTYDGDTMAALREIRSGDDQFYRVEKDYSEAASYLDSAAQEYSAATTYNSQQNRYIQTFVKNLAPRLLSGFDTNHYDFRNMFHDQPAASVMGIKYLLSHSDDLCVEGYERIGQQGSVYIYRNLGTENIGRFFTKTISEKQFRKKSKTIPVWNLLEDVLITGNRTEFAVSKRDLSGREKREATQQIAPQYTASGVEELRGNIPPDNEDAGTVFTKDTGEIVIPLSIPEEPFSGSVIAEFTIAAESKCFFRITMNDERPVSWYGSAETPISLLLPAGTRKLTIRTDETEPAFFIRDLHFYVSDFVNEQKNAAVVRVDALKNDSRVNGSVETGADGILMLAVPYQEGWEAFVDGEPAEILRVDYGFTGLKIQAGTHTFSLKYKAPLFREGVIVSTVCILIWLAALVLTGRKRKKD